MAGKLTAYELIQKIEGSGMLNELINAGIIPTTYSTYKTVFEFYLQEEAANDSRTQAVENTAEHFGTPFRTVYHIIKKMRT